MSGGTKRISRAFTYSTDHHLASGFFFARSPACWPERSSRCVRFPVALAVRLPGRTKEPALRDDLLVVGLDLETGREVHVNEETLAYWRDRDYSGRRTLVCALCYAGIDAAPGTRVPLVVRGKIGGLRRPHFAHPPGQAPVGGHHPESLWHLSAKAVLAAWAARQPGVADVAVERCTPDRTRRSDVRVLFHDGRQVALEVQATPLTDREWSARHADYQRQGITDVWLWRPGTQPHWVVVGHGQLLWELDPGKAHMYLLLGAAHHRPARWRTTEDLHLYAQHVPPCVGDTLLRRELALSTIGLVAGGLVMPDSVHREINNARTADRAAAAQARAAMTRQTRLQPIDPPAHRPAPQPTRQVAAGPAAWQPSAASTGDAAANRGPGLRAIPANWPAKRAVYDSTPSWPASAATSAADRLHMSCAIGSEVAAGC